MLYMYPPLQIGATDSSFVIDPEFGPTMLVRTGIRLELSTSGSLGGITALALIMTLIQVRTEESVVLHINCRAAVLPEVGLCGCDACGITCL